MVVTRYMDGKEVTQADLAKIKITNNSEIAQLVNRVVARMNQEAKQISTTPFPK